MDYTKLNEKVLQAVLDHLAILNEAKAEIKPSKIDKLIVVDVSLLLLNTS